MKFLFLVTSLSFFGIRNTPSDNKIDREKIIEDVVKIESDFAGFNCHCRIGNDRGRSQNEYPNPLHDLGVVFNHGGLVATVAHDRECNRRCAIAAAQWLNSLSDDQLCAFAKKAGVQIVLAYSKVGGRKWTVCGASKSATCCGNGGAIVCPTGWEYDSNPKKCKKLACVAPSYGYNGVLKDKDGKEWGFVYNNSIFQMIPPSITPVVWASCN